MTYDDLARQHHININGQERPDIATIIWRYYFAQTKNAADASQMANAYLNQLLQDKQYVKYF